MLRYIYTILTITVFVISSCGSFANNNEQKKEKYFEAIPEDVEIGEFVLSSLKKVKGEHPSVYFELVNLLYEGEYYDQSAFVFYIGNYSYSLYNHANPNFTKADQRNFDIVGFKYGFENYDYLQSNLENYSKIMFNFHSWYSDHRPSYFGNKKEDDFYEKQLKELEALAIQLRDDPAGFRRDLEEERKAFESGLQ